MEKKLNEIFHTHTDTLTITRTSRHQAVHIRQFICLTFALMNATATGKR